MKNIQTSVSYLVSFTHVCIGNKELYTNNKTKKQNPAATATTTAATK